MKLCAVIYGSSPDKNFLTKVFLVAKKIKLIEIGCLSNISFLDIEADYTFFIKSGDSLDSRAVKLLTKVIRSEHPDLIYSDEAIEYGESKKRFNYYKPDFSPEMILSLNYFRNLLCVKTSLLQKFKFPKNINSSNFLYDLALKVISRSSKVYHLDEVLYISHSSKNAVSYEDFYMDFDQEQGRSALETYCQTKKINSTVLDGQYHGTYRLKKEIIGNPLVSIVIPFRDKPELLKACIDSILTKTIYQNFEIIGIDNGSVEQKTLDLMQAYEGQDLRIKFYCYEAPFNYCKVNNFGVTKAKGEQLLLLNNDTEVISASWIESLLEHSQCENVGIVGAKLLYADNCIQHAGVLTAYIGHPFRGLENDLPGYFYAPHIIRNYNVVTFACVMFKRSVYDQVGKLDENIPASFSDVEYCVRARANNYLNIYTPYACLYHHESKSRNTPATEKEIAFENQEKAYVIRQNPAYYKRDEYYNKHLTKMFEDYSEMSKFEWYFRRVYPVKMFVKKFIPAPLWHYLKKKIKGDGDKV